MAYSEKKLDRRHRYSNPKLQNEDLPRDIIAKRDIDRSTGTVVRLGVNSRNQRIPVGSEILALFEVRQEHLPGPGNIQYQLGSCVQEDVPASSA